MRAHTLRPIDPVPRALVADYTLATNASSSTSNATLMQSLLVEAKNTLSFDEEEFTMLIVDQPNIPPNSTPVVMLVQTNSALQVATKKEKILGVCTLVKVGKYGTNQGNIFPALDANIYLHTSNEKIDFYTAKINIIKQPKHGRLVPESDGNWITARYLPNTDYLGNDSFVMQVVGNGYKVNLHYFMYVTNSAGETIFENKACKNIYWKITEDSSIDSSLTDLTAWQRASELSALLANATESLIGFSDLASTAVGEGLSAQITLDTAAAGHGWYIDPTPLDNADDYLPTSDPTIFKAKAGSAADGDRKSVV